MIGLSGVQRCGTDEKYSDAAYPYNKDDLVLKDDLCRLEVMQPVSEPPATDHYQAFEDAIMEAYKKKDPSIVGLTIKGFVSVASVIDNL